jgi:hypothetical protein
MFLLGFVAVGAAGSMSACTAPVDGLIGIALDVSGQPKVVLMSCLHHLDGVTVIWSDDPAGRDSKHAVFAKWKLPVGYDSPIEWSILSSRPERVTIVNGPAALTPGRTYSIGGGSRDDPYWSADGPDFTAEDFARLHPGEILIPEFLTDKEPPAPTRVSMDSFKQLACP